MIKKIKDFLDKHKFIEMLVIAVLGLGVLITNIFTGCDISIMVLGALISLVGAFGIILELTE